MSPQQALAKAVELAGGQNALARLLGLKQAHIWNWLHKQHQCPAGRAIAVEQVTKGRVSRHELRPDLYPREADQ